MIDAIRKTVEPLRRRIHLAIARAAVKGVSDEGARQRMQLSILRGETREGVERVQQYGMTSHPLPGAQAVIVCVGGNRDHPLVVCADDPRHRKTALAQGEVCLYTDEGDFIHLRRGRVVEISTQTLIVKASQKVRFETPLFETTGSVAGTGNITSGGDVYDSETSMRAMRDVYNLHKHPENDGGGPTDDPNEQMP